MTHPQVPSTQKKTELPSTPWPPTAAPDADFYSEFHEEVEELINSRTRESHWLVPLIVFMVVGATIYLAVLNNKVEYVYSLASACFGYYFGQLVQTPNPPIKKPIERLTGR